jgi:DNA-binding transcriptional regulator LsrR (DeoR family)
MEPIYRDMLADVAAMYYLQEKTQSEIAEALGVSRVKVYRLLKEARDGGVVEIIIHRSRPRSDKLEQELRERFDLTDALVLDTRGMEQAEVWRGMGEIGARYVEKLLKDDSTIAICLGRSTYEVVHAMRTDLHRQVRIAQALGSIPFATQELDSGALARQLANKLGGEVLYLPSPMIADNAEAAAVLRRQPAIERTLAAAREADLALLGIGNLNPAESRLIVATGFSDEQLAAMLAEGAVGDIIGQIFTRDGHLYPSELTDRIIGLTLEELRCIPTVVAVAFGMSKAEAILGALRTGVVDVLATDDSAAREILRMGETRTVRRRCPDNKKRQ